MFWRREMIDTGQSHSYFFFRSVFYFSTSWKHYPSVFSFCLVLALRPFVTCYFFNQFINFFDKRSVLDQLHGNKTTNPHPPPHPTNNGIYEMACNLQTKHCSSVWSNKKEKLYKEKPSLSQFFCILFKTNKRKKFAEHIRVSKKQLVI